jgi:hypothetical protein
MRDAIARTESNHGDSGEGVASSIPLNMGFARTRLDTLTP